MSELVDIGTLTLPKQLRHWASTRASSVALRQKDYGIWEPVTWAEYERQARHFGIGLVKLGLPPKGHCAIICENRKEWVFAQLGCGMVGAVTIGIYPTSPAAEVEYLLRSSDASIVVCEDQEQLDKVLEVRASLPKLTHVVVIDPRGIRHYKVDNLITFDEVVALGLIGEQENPQLVEDCLERQTMDDLALMIFTSGSTGRPKAAMINYGNIAAMAGSTDAIYRCTPSDSTVSYLPLCHVAEQIYTVCLPLRCGVVVNFAESLRTVQSDLREIAPTLFLGVPRIWEKLHAAIEIKIREAGWLRRRLYQSAVKSTTPLAVVPRAQWSWRQRVGHAFWYWIMLRPLSNFIGLRECRLAVSGAAPIAPDMLRFFRALGVPIREGYGMTETSGLVTLQRSAASPLGTVGGPLPGIELRIADDGELLIRGGSVFKGYYLNEAATREAIDEQGWLHTGDVAAAVGDEVRIVDRKKDIMITAGGKNITPSEIENALKFSVYIKESIIIADRRAFVSALIQIDYETVSKWAEEHGLPYTHFRSLADHARVRELVQSEVDRVNAHMPQVQHVRKFHLLTKELDHDDGEVTATMKIKRKSISEKFINEIEALYGGRSRAKELA
ncbi:long-chain acyl-CoA synthetase [Polaromonas sp. OV174]|uniref:AMP-dependent synthetase/ligase n=1 Tax=Polaromonas sp. OV174 TaxID=1855300 RepID=UPI0008F22757|nr:AMP-binding protein [Polaromonas sp. OV174]SFC52503.1 long-chain acyl-CoA synthetase [Polaromonas sp. OV174]